MSSEEKDLAVNTPVYGLILFEELRCEHRRFFHVRYCSIYKSSLDLPINREDCAHCRVQSFRLPLELILHSWVHQGVIPETMTWTGQYFDILSGIASLILGLLVYKNICARAMAWLANFIGCILLANVIRVVIMSSPLPFAWHVSPPLQLIFHIPYFLIGPICVSGALAGHIVLTRALLRK